MTLGRDWVDDYVDGILAEFGVTTSDLDREMPLVWVTAGAVAAGSNEIAAAVEDCLATVRWAKVIRGLFIDSVSAREFGLPVDADESGRAWMVLTFTTAGWSPTWCPTGGTREQYRARFLGNLETLVSDADIIG